MSTMGEQEPATSPSGEGPRLVHEGQPAPLQRTASTVARAAVKQLRPKQWAKNVFMLPALIFSLEIFEPASLVTFGVGVVSFSMLASAGYVFNDYLDREADRKHPKKRFRPIASGALPVPAAVALLVFCLVTGVASGAWLGPMFLLVALTYLTTTLSYSFYFKHKVILDVMFLSSGFVWRALAGALAIRVHVSAWLFLCAAFLSLFLAFNKRRAELMQVGAHTGTRRNLAEYSPKMLDQFQAIVTGSVVLCYALYTVQGPTPWMTLTIPWVLYGIFRYIYLVESKGEGGAPDETLFRDWPMLVTGTGYGLTALAVLVADHQSWLPPLSP